MTTEEQAKEYATKHYPKPSMTDDWESDGWDEGYNSAANPVAQVAFIAGYEEAQKRAIGDLKEISICDIDAPIFTHTMNFRAHFDYIKKQMIERLNQINSQQ